MLPTLLRVGGRPRAGRCGEEATVPPSHESGLAPPITYGCVVWVLVQRSADAPEAAFYSLEE